MFKYADFYTAGLTMPDRTFPEGYYRASVAVAGSSSCIPFPLSDIRKGECLVIEPLAGRPSTGYSFREQANSMRSTRGLVKREFEVVEVATDKPIATYRWYAYFHPIYRAMGVAPGPAYACPRKSTNTDEFLRTVLGASAD